MNVEQKHKNLIIAKIAWHVDVLKLFASIALRTLGPQQLLHYGVTTHCCETSAQALAIVVGKWTFSNATVELGEDSEEYFSLAALLNGVRQRLMHS